MIDFLRLGGRHRGQMAVLLAFAFPGLLAMAGVTVDLGFAYVHRRELQNAVDAAAQAGATKLAQHYESLNNATGLTPPADQTDADIKRGVLCALAGGLPGFTDVSAGCTATALPANASAVPMPDGPDGVNYAWYVSGETPTGCVTSACTPVLGATVGSGAIDPAAAGVRVVVRYSYPTFFAKIVGVQTLNVQASARAMLRPTSAISLFASNGPFIVCGGDGSGTFGAMDLTTGSPMQQILDTSTSPPTVKSAYLGHTFLVHGSHLGDNNTNGDCGITSSTYKGLADETSTGCTSLPCSLPWLGGDHAGPTVGIVQGLPSCSGNNQDNCVMILPIADTSASSSALHVVTFQPFWMHTGASGYSASQANGCNSSNCNIGTLLQSGALADVTAGIGVVTITSGYITSGTFAVQSQPE